MANGSQTAAPHRVATWVQHRPVVAFVALAYAFSWAVWLVYWLSGYSLVFWIGGLGPVLAAAVVTWRLGTLQPWLRRVLHWRAATSYYVLVLAGPVLLYGAMNVVLAALGHQPDPSLLGDRLPAYLATWSAALYAGVVEEPGWRGFLLPRLQQRFTPVRATLLLGVIWGLWHLPVSPLALLVIVPIAFFYTWLYNRTHSVVLCMLLHAGITPAQEHLLLIPNQQTTVALVQIGTLIVAAIALVVATRGRLGMAEATGHP